MFYGQQFFFVDTWDILFRVTFRILTTSCMTWLRRPIAYLPPFAVLVLLFWHICFRLTVYPSTVQHSGHFPVLPSITLRLLSKKFLEGFGTTQSRSYQYSSLRGKSAGQSLQSCLPSLYFFCCLELLTVLVPLFMLSSVILPAPLYSFCRYNLV